MLPLDLTQPPVGYRLRQSPSYALAVVDGLELPLDRLSPEDACAVDPQPRRFSIGDAVTLRFLGRGVETPLVRAQVASVQSEPGGPNRLDFGFRHTDVATARKIASFVETLRREGAVRAAGTRLVNRERLADPERIVHLAEILARNKTRALARAPGDKREQLVRLVLVGCDRERRTLTWDTGSAQVDGSLQAELIGHSAIFLLDRLPVLASAPGRAVTPLPPWLLRARRRAVGRVRASGELLVRFRHPIWREVTAVRTVRDFSFRGLSFWCEAVHDLVYPGLLMDEVQVFGEGVGAFNFRAEVRMVAGAHLTAEPHGGEQAVGMSLTPRSKADRARWATLVGNGLYPRTRTRGDGGPELWDVFERSGYFALSGKEPAVFARRRREFEAAGKKLDAAPELGCRVMWSSERGVECTVSVNKVYRHSWLGHQMARRSVDRGLLPPPGQAPEGGAVRGPVSSAKDALRETFLRAFEAAHADPDIHWFVGYIEGGVRWMRAANIEFAQAHLAEDQAVALPFHLREGVPDANAPHTPGVEISGLDDLTRHRVLAAVSQRYSRAYREAFDLVPSRFDLAEISRRWAKAGMLRGREVRVARRDGVAVAASICERGEPGVNLFHLLDGVRLVPLPEGEQLPPEEREAVLTALLRDAARHYARAGAHGWVYYQELETSAHADAAGLKDLGLGYVWALSARLLPEWMEHVYELTSPRAPEPD